PSFPSAPFPYPSKFSTVLILFTKLPTPPPRISTLSLHDALPILCPRLTNGHKETTLARPINPHSRRQRHLAKTGQAADFVSIPAAGYTGSVPGWPLDNEPARAELDMWNSLWTTPQATMWASMHIEHVIARYVMVTCLAEQTQQAGLLTEVRQMEDRLGLTPLSLQKLQWKIEHHDNLPADTSQSEESKERWAQILDFDRH